MISEYKKRKNELRYCFNILEKFENLKIKNDLGEIEETIIDFNYNADNMNFTYNDFFKIFRSNFILLLYNFIEASVFLFIDSIYQKFEYENIPYLQASEVFQKLFIEYKFLDSFKKNSNFNTYKDKVNEIIEEIANGIVLKFEIKNLSNLSGNVGAKNLREMCKLHGIVLNSRSRSQDPENHKFSLDNIKNERNALAHGRKSFIEVGSDYTVSDLENYYNEIVLLMDDLLNAVKKFIDEKKYKQK